MINLLPPTEKERIKRESNLRVFIIIEAYFLIFCLLFFIALSFERNYILQKLEAGGVYLTLSENSLDLPKIREEEKNIKAFNSKVVELNSFYIKEKDLTAVLEKVTESMPQEIYLKSFRIEGGKKITISGFSLTREALLGLDVALKDSGFDKVQFPASSWEKGQNIDFSVSFELK